MTRKEEVAQEEQEMLLTFDKRPWNRSPDKILLYLFIGDKCFQTSLLSL